MRKVPTSAATSSELLSAIGALLQTVRKASMCLRYRVLVEKDKSEEGGRQEEGRRGRRKKGNDKLPAVLL
ncbi:MAG: hypothetical protein MHM6MM_008985, partial [Cercozoa sp. M6MM]